MNIARNKILELSKSEHFMLQVRNEAMNENDSGMVFRDLGNASKIQEIL